MQQIGIEWKIFGWAILIAFIIGFALEDGWVVLACLLAGILWAVGLLLHIGGRPHARE